jgi:hypothetical protein
VTSLARRPWRAPWLASIALLLFCTLGCPPAARRVTKRRTPPVAASLPASLLPPEGHGPKLRRAEQSWLTDKPSAALRELAAILRTEPDQLEARVLLALVQQRARRPKQAKQAWARVERIIVVKGKLVPFELQTTLLGAAEHYLRRNVERRSSLFLEALWRRFPGSDAAARAQLAVAEQAYRERRWYRVRKACAELVRVQPRHKGNQRCGKLALTARRLLAVGPPPAKQGPLWSWQSPSPQANALHAVWTGPRGHLVAVGAAGTILERGRRDRRWRVVPALVRWGLRGLTGVRRDALYAVGQGGVVLRRGPTGWAVLRRPAAANADLHAAWSPSADTLIAVGDGGVVLRYAKGRFRREQPTKASLHAIWGSSAQRWIAAGDEGTMLLHDAKGWRSVSSDAYENLRAVWGLNKDHVLIAGDRRTVIFFDGKKAKESVQGLADLRAIWGASIKQAWAVGKGGAILRSPGRALPIPETSGGPLGEWRSERSGTTAELRAIAGRGSKVWAVGDGGTILRRRGRRWKLTAGGSIEPLIGVVASGGAAIALGLRGKLMSRRGGRWRATVLPVRGLYRALWSGDARSLVAVGHRGLIVVGDGKAYRRVSSGTPEDLLAVQRCGKAIFAAGTRGTVLRVDESAATGAKTERVPTGQRLRGLAGCRQPIAVGDRGTIVTRRQGRWQRESSDKLHNLYAVWTDPAERIAVAVGEGGQWAIQPGRRPMANITVNMFGRDAHRRR